MEFKNNWPKRLIKAVIQKQTFRALESSLKELHSEKLKYIKKGKDGVPSVQTSPHTLAQPEATPHTSLSSAYHTQTATGPVHFIDAGPKYQDN